ncbi:hypothetical protein EG68_11908 [Paragonimus skrjabini miyazakii]|uniref:Uncharacterized protein n=1 Tax=Paragonimus skrjabini miyazakii TaxID=59628 RepID=A0A8S9Y9Q0_9TREM|nr:hypothetical protein EG68_11908 [Paragonimus skrjabini miyazakii]
MDPRERRLKIGKYCKRTLYNRNKVDQSTTGIPTSMDLDGNNLCQNSLFTHVCSREFILSNQNRLTIILGKFVSSSAKMPVNQTTEEVSGRHCDISAQTNDFQQQITEDLTYQLINSNCIDRNHSPRRFPIHVRCAEEQTNRRNNTNDNLTSLWRPGCDGEFFTGNSVLD